jgi:hypothetical protein
MIVLFLITGRYMIHREKGRNIKKNYRRTQHTGRDLEAHGNFNRKYSTYNVMHREGETEGRSRRINAVERHMRRGRGQETKERDRRTKIYVGGTRCIRRGERDGGKKNKD